MSKGWKIALAVSAVVLFLCGVACVSFVIIGRYTVSKSIATQPEQAAKIGHEIVDYTLPPGYRELMGMNVLGTKWVIIGSDSPDTLMIMLMQFPTNSNMSQEEMQRGMESALGEQSQRRSANLEVVGTQKAIVKGREVTFTVSESQGDVERPLRQVVGMFPSKDGVAMLMVMGEIKTWDQDTLDSFLASIQ